MGKSPAKWIKTLLLGKKSLKSSLSKEKKLSSANKEEVLVSSKRDVSDLAVEPPSISAPMPLSSDGNIVDSEKGIPTQLSNGRVNTSASKAGGNDNTTSNFGNPEDPERIKLDQAAAKAQAAFRGYLARRSFRTLKGIIRLQALIRGHLVRRKAVATLFCTWGIVKLQALARGQKVRCSGIGIEVQEKHRGLLLGCKSSDSRVNASSQVKNLSKYLFVQKLLAPSPAVLPLRLQYGPEEPNSAWQWLHRWTRSQFWECPSQPSRSLASKSQTKGVENQQGKTKRSVRKLSIAKVENGSSRSTSEHEKPKRGLRRVSGNSTADAVREHPQNELEKVKRNLRKLSDSGKEVSDKSEVVNEKTKQTLKSSISDAPDISEQDSAENIIDVTAVLSKPSNLEVDLKLSSEDATLDEPNVCSAVDLPPAENNSNIEKMPVIEKSRSREEQVSDESSKANQRRASFPAKIDNQENEVNNMPKVPSYMAPTESVKARLKGQGSPRITPEVVEKNGLNRRYSLPSSTNSNLSTVSPRPQKFAQVAGKGAIRSDKSLSASRDASDKAARTEWKR